MTRKTITDVAKAAGVSKATVSRVLAGQTKYMREETRQKVLVAIEELGYHPSNAARTLKSKRSCTLGVVGYGLDYYGPSCTLSGIEQEASELGYTILLHLVRQAEANDVGQLLKKMQSRYVDGIIWAVPEIGNNHTWLEDKALTPSVPIIYLTAAPRSDQYVVSVDNYQGGVIATRHLIAQGCQKIGLITGPLEWWEARQRKLGWKEALESVNLPRKEELIVEGNWSAESGEYGLQRLLTRHPEIDGVFVCNDRMALGAVKMAHVRGRQVPQDLAIVGFDDVPDAAYFVPPLSTVRQDMEELGRRAVRKLGQLIEAQHNDILTTPETLMLQPEMIVRESSLFKR
ncbi:MAG: LacI family DNA-binding transcriptional regulator [Anaerolineae bacterium]|nr:LacI family DNA-binding transcriptional regulator [Anaerolineae bacterium]